MRGLIFTTLILTLPGCSYDNPLFGVSGETPSSGGADTTAASAALTDEPVTSTADPSVATSVTTSGEPGTTAVDPVDSTTTVEPGTTTVDPGTTTGPQSGTSDPVDSSSTGIDPDPMPLCPVIDVAFKPYLLKNGQPLAQCPPPDVYIYGKLAVGDPLKFAASVNCGALNNDVYTLGTGLALPDQAIINKCLKTALKLVDTEDGCKISQIKTYDPANPNMVYLAAAFSASSDGLPITPQANNNTYCGCAEPDNNGMDCCTGLDPGELVLLPTNNLNIMVEQFGHATVTLDDNSKFEFYNLQSWVGPQCMADPAADHHIDWIAVRKP